MPAKNKSSQYPNFYFLSVFGSEIIMMDRRLALHRIQTYKISTIIKLEASSFVTQFKEYKPVKILNRVNYITSML
jgi:hypothetical protein